jgi:hypothetical protein
MNKHEEHAQILFNAVFPVDHTGLHTLTQDGVKILLTRFLSLEQKVINLEQLVNHFSDGIPNAQ